MERDIQDVFAFNMRKYRKAAHLSQEKLAELASLHRTYIGGIEQRRVNVSLKNIGKIASALKVDPALLFLAPGHESSLTTPLRNASHPTCRLHAEEAGIARADTGERGTDELRPGGAPSPDDSTTTMAPLAETALIIWTETETVFKPIEPTRVDITAHIVTELTERGYTGNELLEQYNKVVENPHLLFN